MSTETQSLLIRLVMHPTNNPHMIDKLIILKGLPYEWVFKRSKYKFEHEDGTVEEAVGDNLLPPWEPDADVNIPRDVRDLTESITYVHWYPGGAEQGKPFKGFWDKRTVWGLKLDYGYGPAQELWAKIDEYIENTIPRGEKIPQAVQVSKDHHSEFRTFLAKRGKNLSSYEMVEMDVPVIDLRRVIIPSTVTVASVQPPVILKTVVSVPTEPAPPTPTVKEDNNLYKCEECNKEFEKERALRMHKVGAHRKEKVKA